MFEFMKQLRGMFTLFAIRSVGLFSLFGINLVIARSGGPSAQGQFQLALSWVIIGATIGRLGLDQLMLRNAAEGVAERSIKSVYRRLWVSMLVSSPFLLAVTLSVWGYQWLSAMDNSFLRVMALAIPAMGLLMITTEALRGWQLVNVSVAWQTSLPQGFVLVGTVVMTTLSTFTAQKFAILYVASFTFATIYSLFIWRRRLPPETQIIPSLNLETAKDTVQGGLHFWAYSILAAVTAWVDILVLGQIASPELVGHYSAVIRTGAILGTVAQISSVGLVARLAVLYSQNEMKEFRHLVRNYIYIFTAGAVISILITMFFSAQIMGIWGHAFVGDSHLLIIYILFQGLNLVTAISSSIALVVGLEKQMVANQFLNLCIKCIGTLWFYSMAGIGGAILASGMALIATNLVAAYAVFNKVKIE